jgi:plastocyanin
MSKLLAPGLRIAALALLLAVVVLIAGCEAFAGNQPQVFLEIRTQPGEGVAYDPPAIIAPSGTLVALSLVNVSTIDHNLVFLDPLDVRTEEIVRPGETAGVQFVTPPPGTYEFVCTIHEQMRGSLVTR